MENLGRLGAADVEDNLIFVAALVEEQNGLGGLVEQIDDRRRVDAERLCGDA